MSKYETTFEDERVEDSVDDQPVPELSKRDKDLYSECWRNMLLRC
jgi:hypothetical protein